MAEATEQVTINSEAGLIEVLKKNWDNIVVDIGSGNRISTNVEKGTLLVLVDPQANPGRIEWGENYKSKDGRLIIVPREIEEVAGLLSGRANRVQIIGPDPDYVIDICGEATSLLAPDGEMVVIFDTISNKEEKVDNAMEEIINSLDKTLNYKFLDTRDDDVDPNEFVGGELNTDFAIGRVKILVIST